MPGYRLSSGVYSHEGMTAARTRISEEMSKTVFRVGTESRSDARDGDNWPTEAWHREDIIQPYRLTGSLCCRSAAFCAEGAAATHSSNKGGKLSRRVTTILRLCALFPKKIRLLLRAPVSAANPRIWRCFRHVRQTHGSKPSAYTDLSVVSRKSLSPRISSNSWITRSSGSRST
jgi:hypothetical protein